jgi:hypothetical protein
MDRHILTAHLWPSRPELTWPVCDPTAIVVVAIGQGAGEMLGIHTGQGVTHFYRIAADPR